MLCSIPGAVGREGLTHVIIATTMALREKSHVGGLSDGPCGGTMWKDHVGTMWRDHVKTMCRIGEGRHTQGYEEGLCEEQMGHLERPGSRKRR